MTPAIDPAPTHSA